MTNLSTTAVLDAVVTLLVEAYAGPPDPKTTWFIDNEPDSGVLGLLKNVSAEQASKSVDGSGESGTTIASHAEHLRWSLGMMNAAVRGEPFEGKWSESWLLVQVDQAGWDRLRGDLRREFETLRDAIKSQTSLPEEYLVGLIALLPHGAYHLGNIRQMIERVK